MVKNFENEKEVSLQLFNIKLLREFLDELRIEVPDEYLREILDLIRNKRLVVGNYQEQESNILNFFSNILI